MKPPSEQVLSVVVVLGIVCLFVAFVHLPQRRELDDLALKIEDRYQHLSQANQKVCGLIPLNERVQSLQEIVARFNSRLTDRSELSAFLENIVAHLKSAELTSQEIRPQSPTSNERYTELPVTVTFSGPFRKVCTFLANMEGLRQLTRIEELNLQSDRGDTPTIRAKMVMNIYCNRS